MAYKIDDTCISCGACEPMCPETCIKEGDGQYVIDADKCTSCAACAEACPVNAIAKE